MKTRIYVDGHITSPEEAVIPVLDHGFLLGDSVYEVIWWHRGVLVQEAEHMERLLESGRRLYMDLQHEPARLAEMVHQTVTAAEVGPDEDAYVRLIVTRGAGPLGLDLSHVPRRSVVVIVAPANRPSAEAWERGFKVQVVERRRNPRVALDPRAKTGNYLNNVLALHEARLAGADDAVMLNEQGQVTEATTANLYVVREEGVATPPLEAGILKGTTRTRILGLLAEHGVPAAEAPLTPRDLFGAREVLLSSSVRGVLPVVAVDGRAIGDGRPGPLTRQIHAWFLAAADAEAARAARHVRPAAP